MSRRSPEMTIALFNDLDAEDRAEILLCILTLLYPAIHETRILTHDQILAETAKLGEFQQLAIDLYGAYLRGYLTH